MTTATGTMRARTRRKKKNTTMSGGNQTIGKMRVRTEAVEGGIATRTKIQRTTTTKKMTTKKGNISRMAIMPHRPRINHRSF